MGAGQVIKTLWNYKKIIVAFSLIIFVLLFLLLFFVSPIRYAAPVTLLPPEGSSNNPLSSLLTGGGAASFLESGSGSANSQLYAEILKSRSATEYVIRKLDLVNRLGYRDFRQGVGELGGSVETSVSKEGIITLKVPVSTPVFGRFKDINDSLLVLSPAISNAYVEALDIINKEKLATRARDTRRFIESQLELTQKKLEESENALKDFEEKNKAVALPEQLEAAMQNAAELKSRIIAAEIELKMLLLNSNPDNAEVRAAEKRLDVLREKYAELETGENMEGDYLPAFGNIPDISLEFARLTRETKIQNEVYLLLQKQYYNEKIRESKDIPTVQVLDEAIVPSKPESPRLLFHTFGGGLAAFLVISAIVVFMENRKFLKKKEE